MPSETWFLLFLPSLWQGNTLMQPALPYPSWKVGNLTLPRSFSCVVTLSSAAFAVIFSAPTWNLARAYEIGAFLSCVKAHTFDVGYGIRFCGLIIRLREYCDGCRFLHSG
jgi:hypothetical protein